MAEINVRAAAHSELCRYAKNESYVNIALDSAIRRLGLTGRDRVFFTALVYGVTERQITIDYYLAALSSKPLRKLDLTVLVALRLGAYQLLFMNGIPESAACNESVKLVRRSAASAAPFVNAVLRSLIRRREKITFPDRKKDPDGFLSARYSVPRELCSGWREMYGEEQAEAILLGMDGQPAVTLRTNTLKCGRNELLSKLEADGIKAAPSPSSEFGIRLLSQLPVGELECMRDGLCFVEDDASSLAVSALAPHPGDTVIDICSAPGGKSFSAAMLMENRGRIISHDIYESKLRLIKDGAERLGISVIEPSVADGSVFVPEQAGAADCVICDVPCSGLGVLAKKPDMRLRAGERLRESNELAQLQYRILRCAAGYLRRGGRLLYSTCTLNKTENEENVLKFLSENPGFELMTEKTLFPDPALPAEERTDGFFYAVMVKKADGSSEEIL